MDKTIVESEKTIIEPETSVVNEFKQTINEIIKKDSSSYNEEHTEQTIKEDRTVIESENQSESETEKTIIETKPDTMSEPEIKSFRNLPLLELLPATGGEADIYTIEQDGEKRILKLYRYGMNPKEEVLKKTKGLSDNFPEHVVRIYEYGYDEKTSRWYEIQEYAKYGSLKDFSEIKPDKKSLNIIIEEIVEALKVFHDHNVLHCDIKPSNILVRQTKPLDLIFTDFGISSMLDAELSKKMTAVKGTPLYWSPESFTGVVGKAADYWSLGIIFYELLTGKHPFSGLDTKVIMYTLSTKGVSIAEEISDNYKLMLKGLLTREPEKRWNYEHVKRWLSGDRNIPVHHIEEQSKGKKYEKPFNFQYKDYYSLEDLVAAFTEGEETWENAKKYLNRGFLQKRLENDEDYDNFIAI